MPSISRVVIGLLCALVGACSAQPLASISTLPTQSIVSSASNSLPISSARDGSEPTTDNTTIVAAPRMSESSGANVPSTLILFQSGGLVRTVMPDGSGSTVVAPDVPASQEHPDWSPDGTRVLFDTEFAQLWTVNADGSEPTVVYECVKLCQSMQDGAWSPGGAEIAFTVAESTDGATTFRSAVLVLDLVTGTTRTAYEDLSGVVWLFSPRWAPDGSAIVVEADIFASNSLDEEQTDAMAVIVAPLDGGPATEIARWELSDSHAGSPDWSPAGDLIVFSRDHNLYSVAPTGGSVSQLTDFDGVSEHAIQPTFTPDGTRIVFTYVLGTFDVDDVPVTGIIATDGTGFEILAEGVTATHPRIRP